MTELEAAETLLRGSSTIPCSKCSGKGWLDKDPDRDPNKNVLNIVQCTNCRASGKLVNPTHVEARIVLSLEPAPLPTSILFRPHSISDRLKLNFSVDERE